jgi:hypothetical protein
VFAGIASHIMKAESQVVSEMDETRAACGAIRQNPKEDVVTAGAPSSSEGRTLKVEVSSGLSRPVLTPEQFRCLCSAPPLQGPQVNSLHSLRDGANCP